MANELAKAYVQIVPSTRGIQGSISQALGGEAAAAGKSAGSSIVGAIRNAIITAGIGKALSATLTEGADLEQSIGGVETLFKTSADKVKAAAAEAYRTAGMSANEYMELATSFSASLLQSTAGDTAKAADIADMAMQDMSDNANKMGSNMEDIKNAYQGFAKQNYTMLDNLKLGYGGTKEEMQRLLADAQKITGVKYDISSLSDVYSAIHVIQGELDITGTTAQEAATTLSGSFAAMKAAGKNVLAALTLGQDLGPALDALAQTFTTWLTGNLLPAVWNILSALPGALVTFVQALAPQLTAALLEFLPGLQAGMAQGLPQMLEAAGQMVTQLCTGIQAAFPRMIETGGQALAQLISGLSAALPQLAQMGLELLSTLVNTLVQNLPQLLTTGGQALLTLLEGISQTLPQILPMAARTVLTMVTGILQNLPQILQAGVQVIASLIRGIGEAAPGIIDAAFEVVDMLWDTVTSIDWVQLGKDIIAGMINGIGAMGGALWDAAANVARGALDSIKNFFGIASPSKVMRDQVGRWLPAGIALGMLANTRPLRSAMDSLARLTTDQLQQSLPLQLAVSPGLPAAAPASGGISLYQTIHTHDSLSPAELTREAENFLRRARWKNP